MPLNEEEAVLLGTAWQRLAGGGPEAAAVGAELLDRWNEPHRRYHTLLHLWEALRAVDVLQGEAGDADGVRYAVWFHDAVYEGRPGRDEEESAELAARLLELVGEEPARIGEVVRLVGVTATHRPEEWDADGKVVSDADLSVLAGPTDEYLAYTAAIRAEYRHIPDRVFRAGRSRVLRSLLDGPHVFHTSFGRAHWEARARVNMLAELDRLASSAPLDLPPP